ncbi:S8 family serine peptidase [Virgisporangium aurantiacum]|uniref:Peptidase S8/S53 domain-containing protein n=1 Tax=Virgisporangium aurantiacum TaxID=175570 RepID=A0A8J3ZF78_9ACTN|nr:S8 family serine peptidase [Virgisporangium aurantiacum]GIJ63049.1 hypothetical protein Vau01_105650 [Virgisporangium aurantiacum]
MSAAILAGIVALVRQKRPNLTLPQLHELLKSTATDKGAPGFDSEYGWGGVDPVKALTAPDPVTSTPAAAPGSPRRSLRSPHSGGPTTFLALAVATVIWGGGLALVIFLTVFLRRRIRRRIRRRRREAATRAEPAANRRGG